MAKMTIHKAAPPPPPPPPTVTLELSLAEARLIRWAIGRTSASEREAHGFPEKMVNGFNLYHTLNIDEVSVKGG